MIADEAVEAAARRFAALAGYDWDKTWDTTADVEADVRADIMRQAREILEAAAPFMLAGAWAEGAQAGFESTSEGFNGECAFDHCAPDDYPPTNPYSGEKWEVQDYQP